MDRLNHRTDLPVWMIYDADPALPPGTAREHQDIVATLFEAMRAVGHPVEQTPLETSDLDGLLGRRQPREVIIFNWIEDLPGIPLSCARAAQQMEAAGFTFTGTSASMLAFSQDKRRVKRRLRSRGIPTPNWQVYNSTRRVTWNCFPAIVKPAFEHCSIGISRESVVQSREELVRRLDFVLRQFKQPAIVEEFIDGREFHVGVVGNGKLQMLPPGEIDYSPFNDIHDRLCTFESNEDPTCLAYRLTAPRLPCDLSRAQMELLEKVVTAAYRSTGCRDFARLDIRLRDGIFYVLDVNPNADISPNTSLILGAGLAGYSYGQFGSLLVNLAARRHPYFSKSGSKGRLDEYTPEN